VIWAEIWVIFLLFLQILCYYFPGWGKWLVLISIYVLFNIFLSAANDLIENPVINKFQKCSYFIEIRNPVRWLLLSTINIAQIVLSFGLLFLVYGVQFEPQITDSTTAIYQSLITFTTLGYGEIIPVCNFGKKIVILELSYFLLFLVLKLPAVLSAFEVKRK
jgi:hypothetical protein